MRVLRKTRQIFGNLNLQKRFFLIAAGVVFLFSISFPFPVLFLAAQLTLLITGIFLITEVILLFSTRTGIRAFRRAPKTLSLGDQNQISLRIVNESRLTLHARVFEELPEQLQERDFELNFTLGAGAEHHHRYAIRPLTRGTYQFGRTNIVVHTPIGLLARRYRLQTNIDVPAFPSIIQMKKYELIAFARTSTFSGIKKVRRIGHSYEFEQIKTYVQGDDVRSINWKATGRRGNLMVNQYEDERSQQMYTIIDKSRSMHMPFHGMSLLDYAVNSSLVIANIALRKYDRTGLISFSDVIGSTIKAERSQLQLKKILNALYNEKPRAAEANYDLLYRAVKNVVKSRSLLFLYTNFESAYAMERALPLLKKISYQHLLVVVIFENTELLAYSRKESEYLTDIYTQTIAEKLLLEKKHMVMKLRKFGIHVILSKPEDLSINTVNKYLELKAKGLF